MNSLRTLNKLGELEEVQREKLKKRCLDCLGANAWDIALCVKSCCKRDLNLFIELRDYYYHEFKTSEDMFFYELAGKLQRHAAGLELLTAVELASIKHVLRCRRSQEWSPGSKSAPAEQPPPRDPDSAGKGASLVDEHLNRIKRPSVGNKTEH